MLSHEDGTVVDSISFGKQLANVAMARMPNGTGNFMSQAPSFNKNNELVSSVETTLFKQHFKAYPNPSNEQLTLDFGAFPINQPIQISLRDMLGHVLLQSTINHSKTILLSTAIYPNGVYYLDIQVGGNTFSKKVIVQHLN